MQNIEAYVKQFYGVTELSPAQREVHMALMAAYSHETASALAKRLKMAKAELCAVIKRVHRTRMQDVKTLEGMITL